MTGGELLAKHCVEFVKGSPAMERAEAEALLKLVPLWELSADGKQLRTQLRFDSFTEAAKFVMKLAPIADVEDHHPDVRIFNYRQVEVTFTTRSIGGLSDNDFVMAAKVNELMG
jgi:4a-hydroxytetrahydrobiopterin dehydratase